MENPNAGHRKRLRERFRKTRLRGFHDYEMVELILAYAIPRKDVKPLAKALIRRFNGLRGVLDASVDELVSVKGMGENAAVLVGLIKAVAGEYLKEKVMRRDVIRSAGDVLDYLDMALSGEKVEKFLAIYLNSKNEVLGVETLHEGTISQTFVYPRKIVERAFSHNARAIILVHNHPSGDPTPSVADRRLTEELLAAARPLDLIIHDHIIIGKNSHVSGRELGWLGEVSRVL